MTLNIETYQYQLTFGILGLLGSSNNMFQIKWLALVFRFLLRRKINRDTVIQTKFPRKKFSEQAEIFEPWKEFCLVMGKNEAILRKQKKIFQKI